MFYPIFDALKHYNQTRWENNMVRKILLLSVAAVICVGSEIQADGSFATNKIVRRTDRQVPVGGGEPNPHRHC